MYQTFRKVQYAFLRVTTYSKFENTIMLCINGFFFATLPVGTIPEYILSSEMKKWLIYFYGITLVLLVVERIFWNRYYTKRWAGVAEERKIMRWISKNATMRGSVRLRKKTAAVM